MLHPFDLSIRLGISQLRSQGNIQARRDALKEDQLPYRYKKILDTTNLRRTTLHAAHTSKIVVKSN